jgi:PAS domain S-box-containing protein
MSARKMNSTSAAPSMEEMFSLLLEHSPSYVFFKDDQGKAIQLSRNFETILGKPLPEILGQSLNELFPSDLAKSMAADDQRVLREGKTVTVEENLNSRYYQTTKFPIIKDGKPVFIAGFMVDVTARKQTECEHKNYEQQLQQAQKLESLGALAGGIAHDFNNLMGGIFGYIDMAREESRNDKVSRYLGKAMSTIERARGLTQQLLTFSRGGDPVQMIAALFPFVQETALFALNGSNVTCRFDVPEDLWPCNYDKNQIAQVIDNIVLNAQQAMPQGGAIDIMAGNISFIDKEHPALAAGKYVKLSIQDSGMGIPEEILPRIFDPFFTTKAKGHGLGLATCHSIIKKHGGCIEVESEHGKGSAFHLYLPVSAENTAVSEEKAARHKGSGTILLMDDEEVILETIGRMLEALGYTVVCKKEGHEALHFFIEETVEGRSLAGMILDLTVPGGMGGKSVVTEIRRLNASIPVFVLSGYADDPIMKNPTDYGFTASICKPFRKVELEEMLEKYMQRPGPESNSCAS